MSRADDYVSVTFRGERRARWAWVGKLQRTSRMSEAGFGRESWQACASLGPSCVLRWVYLSSEADQCSNSEPSLLDLGEALRQPQSLSSQTAARQLFFRAGPGSRGWLVEIIPRTGKA